MCVCVSTYMHKYIYAYIHAHTDIHIFFECLEFDTSDFFLEIFRSWARWKSCAQHLRPMITAKSSRYGFLCLSWTSLPSLPSSVTNFSKGFSQIMQPISLSCLSHISFITLQILLTSFPFCSRYSHPSPATLHLLCYVICVIKM